MGSKPYNFVPEIEDFLGDGKAPLSVAWLDSFCKYEPLFVDGLVSLIMSSRGDDISIDMVAPQIYTKAHRSYCPY